MRFKSKRITSAIAFLLVFATSQIYVGASLAERGSVVPGESAAITPQDTTGILTTQGNRDITVNGASAMSGATIVSGTRIETPQGVGATVRLGNLGWLDIAPQAALTLTFDRTGSVNVLLSEGCVVLHTRRGTTGQIETADGVIGKSDPTKDDVLRVCSQRGAIPPTNTGAGGTPTLTAGTATATGGGISTTTGVVIGAVGFGALMAAAIIVPCRRGRNPSPGEPRGRNDECR